MTTILIVDDEQPIRELLALVMHGVGYETVTASHGGDALAAVAASRPDLVLADVMMPVLSGLELCRRLKSEPTTRTIPVILMSAVRFDRARLAEADAFLAKPFDLNQVEALVERQLAAAGAETQASREAPTI